MKKLILFMLLAVSAPLVAITDDAYQQAVQSEIDNFASFVLIASKGAHTPESARAVAIKHINEDLQNTNTALEFFVEANNLPAVQYLIEEKNADPNYIDRYGFTVLQRAGQYKVGADLIDYLRLKGAR